MSNLIEPEIDFDVLFEEWQTNTLSSEWTSVGFVGVSAAAGSFKNFIKSKHLTAPKKYQIPTKKTWTIKKEWEKLFLDFEFDNIRYWGKLSEEPAERLLKYYDLHEEPDYSKIPVGSVVMVDDIVGIVRNNIGKIVISCCTSASTTHTLNYEKIKSIEILKMQEVK